MSDSTLLSRSAERSKNVAMKTAWDAGQAWWSLMAGLQRDWQRASLMALTSHVRPAETPAANRMSRPVADVEIVELGEERLNVGTHTIQGETTRIRRRVIALPVEQQVTLRDETVVVERRPVTDLNPKPNVLTETVIEMSDSRQVPTVWKSLHVAEEVVLRKQVTERVEQVREIVRHDVIDVEHARENVMTEPRNETTLEIVSAYHDMEAERAAAAQAALAEKQLTDTLLDKKPQPGGKKN